MKTATLKETQELITTILRDVDKICKENGIEYWIESGTLLGAIRHGGFIPWDDDIDIAMMREDYNKFIEIAKEKLPEDLYYQDISMEDGIVYSWAKIRHKFSKIVEEKDAIYSEGMFIDIFPYDYYDNKEDENSKIKKKYLNQLKVVYNSELDYEKDIKKNIRRLYCKLYNKFILNKTIKDVIIDVRNKTKNIDTTKKEFVGYGVEVINFDNLYKTDTIFPLQTIKFDNIEVLAPNNIEKYLEETYGLNYMDIPKEEDRYNHFLGLYIEKGR